MQSQQRNRGQIVAKGDKRWLVRVYVGTTPAGTRRYDSKTVHGTYKQAETHLTALLREKDTDSLITPGKDTVQTFCAAWLETKSRNIGQKTALDYKDRLSKDVYPFIGHLRLQQVSAAVIDSLYGSLISDRKLSNRTVRYTHSILRQAFQRAVHRKMMRANPCDPSEIELPAIQRREMLCLTPAETAVFLEKTHGTKYGCLWRTELTTGMRPQEAHALQWSDLETDGKTYALSIQRALVQIENGAYEVRPYMKNTASVRRIGISKETADALLQHKKEQAALILSLGAAYHRNGFIFSTATGKFLDFTTARRAWKRALLKAKLPVIRYYDSRHTHLTHLLSAGVNAKAVAARAGQTDPHVLLTTYAHVLPEVAEGAADLVERQMEGANARRIAGLAT